METIYISIPSLRDTETKITIENALASADFPDRIFIGVSVLDTDTRIYDEVKKLSKENSNIVCDYHKLDVKDTSLFGTGKGRKRASSMYSGQDYLLQIDSHTLFDSGWDTILINLFKDAENLLKTDRLVLTGYLGHYSYDDDKKRFKHEKCGVLHYPFFLPDEDLIAGIPMWSMADTLLPQKEKFVPCVKFNGNFAFGNRKFVDNSGVDVDSIFYDEEINQSVNLIGNDFAMVFPILESFPLTHLYTDQINENGGERMFFTQYLSEDKKGEIDGILTDNYKTFINNPENQKKLKKYSKYARIDFKRGAIAYNYIPKSFIVKD